MTVYQAGETARLIATITNKAGVAADPATIKISINKQNRTSAISSISMTKDAVGSYHYDYLTADDIGTYSYKVTGVGSGGRITIVKSNFKVERSI